MPVDTRVSALSCLMNKWCKAGALLLLSCLLIMPPLYAASLPYLTKLTASAAPTMPAPAAAAANGNPSSPADEKAAYAALADILNNDASRAELIKQLRAASQGQTSQTTPLLTPAAEEKDTPTLLDSVTDFTRVYSHAMAAKLNTLSKNITSAPQHQFNRAVFILALSRFGLLAVATFAFYFLCRWLVTPLLHRMGRWGRTANGKYKNGVKRVLVVFGAFAIEMIILVAAVMLGQFLAEYLNADSRTIARQLSLFLNAFAVMELFKALLRMIFCPRYPELRRLPMSDGGARYWNIRLSLVSGIIGYGTMVIVPIIANQINAQTAALANFVIMLTITAYVLWLVVRNKRNIQKELEQLANRSLAFFSVFIRAFSLIWHWLAVVYFIMLFLLTQFDPGNSLKFMVTATVKSLMIISVGALISGLLTRWISRHITLSPDTRRNYPQLQQRINVYVSSALKVCRVLVVFSVMLLLLDAWHLFNLGDWLKGNFGARLVDALLRIFIILIFSALGWTLLASIIENRLTTDAHGRPQPSARTRTLLTLFRNALSVIISTITIMIILSEIGVNIAPLLAGAGALGLAISFGAQTLVKDVITGVFIQFENGMNTGDLVTIGDITGVVERMTIRSVGVRQDTGAYFIVPFSSITTFANFVRGIGSFVANYDVDRDEDIDRVNQALRDAVTELMSKDDIRTMVIGEPNFGGVVGLTNQSFTVRVSFTTQALKQWTVRFTLDGLVKNQFEAAGIRPPYQAVRIVGSASAAARDNADTAANDGLPPPAPNT
ncbi:mechanosensitive channel protein [Sodalis sp. dw_96]|uniref:mechanosensitive channel protein n=1 Tax=Sodalis sp. dw_96 TaxID=2719794 RepID=UPI002103413B|nr:mechanosensitive channel protein [Sodalis sp. dw_96]